MSIRKNHESPGDGPRDAHTATTKLIDSLPTSLSRRRLLRTAAGVAGVIGAAAAGLLTPSAVYAEATGGSNLAEYFNILATGEALFVTLYSHAVANFERLEIEGAGLNALKAILAEEQIHFDFARAHGGVPATTHFSFPFGRATFTNRSLFLQTQQLGEDLTNGALLAWIKDMATMNLPRLAQIGGQLMQVEGGHRVVGRVIMHAEPWDNWAFGPVALNSFLQVPTVVKAAGFLSPRPGNDFEYHAVSTHFPGLTNTAP